jgi:hypothetical protein
MEILSDQLLRRILLVNLSTSLRTVRFVCRRWRKILSGKLTFRTRNLLNMLLKSYVVGPRLGPGWIEADFTNGKINYPLLYYPDDKLDWHIVISYCQFLFLYRNNKLRQYAEVYSKKYLYFMFDTTTIGGYIEYGTDELLESGELVTSHKARLYDKDVKCEHIKTFRGHIRIIHEAKGLHILIVLKLAYLKNKQIKDCFIATLSWDLLLYIHRMLYSITDIRFNF